MVFDPHLHDYSDIQPIQYPFLQQDGEGTGEDLFGSSNNKKLNFASIENENSDKNNSYFKSSEVIENESSLEKMLTTLTGKTKCQRSTKDKAVKFPLKLMYVWTCGDYDHIVHWKVNQIDGSDVFVIDDIDAFTNEVLPSLFKVAKFVSFQRKMYRWGILKTNRSKSERKKKGSVSYSHPLFKKGDFFLAAQMTCSGSEVESQKTASKEKKKVQRQKAQSKSGSKQSRKNINRNIPVSSNTVARDDHNDDPEDLNLFVYSPEDGRMTSMRVSTILKHANKERSRFSNPILSNQMCYTQTYNMAAKDLPEQMPNLNSMYTLSIQGNPNFLPLDRIQENQEELCGPMNYHRRGSTNDIRHFPDSVERGVPTLNTFNPDQLLKSAFSSLRERTTFEC